MKTRPAARRFRLLHFFYYRGAAVQFWISRRLRPAGIGALMVTSLASFNIIGQQKNSIFQIFCFSLGLLLLSFVWVLFRRAKVSAVLHLPKHSTVDETLRYSVRLKNDGRRTLRGARIEQTPPDPRPGLAEFSHIEEPGEAQRNIFDRTMAYYRWQWLVSRIRGFTSGECETSIDLQRGESKIIPMTLTPCRRGVFAMDDLRLLLPDPLGFFQKCRPLPTAPVRLIVLPKRYRLPQFEMPGSAAFRIGGEETSNAIGTSGEFVGLREYRSGDSMRQIHWKSWAHTGKPMVKELEDTFYPRYALVLDTFPGSPDRHVFEEMVSVASSFVVGLDRSEALLDLMFIADKAHTVTAGRGMERAEKLLEVLAGVQIEENERFKSLSTTVIRHREKITSSLLILNGWDELRAQFVTQLRKSGIVCVPLVIGHGQPPANLPGYWLDSQNLPRDLLRLPPQLSATI